MLTSQSHGYVEWSDALLLVFSLADAASYRELRDMTRTLQQMTKRLPVLVLIGAKSDLTHFREVSKSQAQSLANDLNCAYVETSARTCRESVDNAFETLYSALETTTANDPHTSTSSSNRWMKNCFTLKKKPTGLMNLRQHLKSLTDFRSRTHTF